METGEGSEEEQQARQDALIKVGEGGPAKSSHVWVMSDTSGLHTVIQRPQFQSWRAERTVVAHRVVVYWTRVIRRSGHGQRPVASA